MAEFKRPIAYLENSDFDSEGNLVNPQIPKNKPVVIMIQSSWCGHCRNAKPAFQEFANKSYPNVFCATIQADGERESEKQLGKRLKVIKPGFLGFPDYVLYKNGKRVDVNIQGRSVSALEQFAKN